MMVWPNGNNASRNSTYGKQLVCVSVHPQKNAKSYNKCLQQESEVAEKEVEPQDNSLHSRLSWPSQGGYE